MKTWDLISACAVIVVFTIYPNSTSAKLNYNHLKHGRQKSLILKLYSPVAFPWSNDSSKLSLIILGLVANDGSYFHPQSYKRRDEAKYTGGNGKRIGERKRPGPWAMREVGWGENTRELETMQCGMAGGWNNEPTNQRCPYKSPRLSESPLLPEGCFVDLDAFPSLLFPSYHSNSTFILPYTQSPIAVRHRQFIDIHWTKKQIDGNFWKIILKFT